MTTLVLDAGGPGEPRTHAFVIGVGAYRHLEGGSDPRLGIGQGMKQLSSPPISARHFTNWLLDGFVNPGAKLGTIELLLSERPPSPEEETGELVSPHYISPDGLQTWAIESALIANLEVAYGMWRTRCEQDPNNVAIFYFCGHGVSIQGVPVLLAEDFGENSLKPYASAFNMNALRRGMLNCQAGSQYYFVDACNNEVQRNLKLDVTGVTCFEATSHKPPFAPDLVAIDASKPDHKAFAKEGCVSRFTEALVKCLGGSAAIKEGDVWNVYTTNLYEAVTRMMTEYAADDWKQVPYLRECTGRRVIHQCLQPPRFAVNVCLNPQEAAQSAQLSLVATEDVLLRWERPPMSTTGPGDAVWKIPEIAAGIYTLNADFPTGVFRATCCQLFVLPPGPEPMPHTIRCETR